MSLFILLTLAVHQAVLQAVHQAVHQGSILCGLFYVHAFFVVDCVLVAGSLAGIRKVPGASIRKVPEAGIRKVPVAWPVVAMKDEMDFVVYS